MRSIARNTTIALFGQGLPLVVAVCAMPLLTHKLGTDRVGLLSIVWVTVSYFSILDLGIGRAVTNIVSHALGRGESSEIRDVFWVAVICQLIMGAVAAVVLWFSIPTLVAHVLRVPAGLEGEVF